MLHTSSRSPPDAEQWSGNSQRMVESQLPSGGPGNLKKKEHQD